MCTIAAIAAKRIVFHFEILNVHQLRFTISVARARLSINR